MSAAGRKGFLGSGIFGVWGLYIGLGGFRVLGFGCIENSDSFRIGVERFLDYLCVAARVAPEVCPGSGS